jgi:hypothetical protein
MRDQETLPIRVKTKLPVTLAFPAREERQVLLQHSGIRHVFRAGQPNMNLMLQSLQPAWLVSLKGIHRLAIVAQSGAARRQPVSRTATRSSSRHRNRAIAIAGQAQHTPRLL